MPEKKKCPLPRSRQHLSKEPALLPQSVCSVFPNSACDTRSGFLRLISISWPKAWSDVKRPASKHRCLHVSHFDLTELLFFFHWFCCLTTRKTWHLPCHKTTHAQFAVLQHRWFGDRKAIGPINLLQLLYPKVPLGDLAEHMME